MKNNNERTLEPIPNDFSLENCLCDRESRNYNSDCPLLNKLNIPEEYINQPIRNFFMFLLNLNYLN